MPYEPCKCFKGSKIGLSTVTHKTTCGGDGPATCSGNCTEGSGEVLSPIYLLRKNVNLSDIGTVNKKNKECLTFFETYKNIASFPFIDGNVYGIPILELMRDNDKNKYENCLALRSKTKTSKLSFTERKNLYNNIKSQILSQNTLNLDLYLAYSLKKSGYPSLPDTFIANTVSTTLTQAIWTIFLNTEYGEEALQYNYSEAFNFFYTYTLRWLYYLEPYLFSKCNAELTTCLYK